MFITKNQVHYAQRKGISHSLIGGAGAAEVQATRTGMLAMRDENAANSTPDIQTAGGQPIQPIDTLDTRQDEAMIKFVQRRILVVEDDLSLAHLEAGILTAQGYIVTTVCSGEEAIEEIQRSLPDLVVLDLDLSGQLNGWDVLQELRALAKTPVLLTSAATAIRQHMLHRGEARATLDHLPKPYHLPILLKRIERMLNVTPPLGYAR